MKLKRILIPTDFSGHSLTLVQTVLENEAGPIDLILSFGYRLDNSSAELFFVSRSQIVKSIVSRAFLDAVEALKKDFNTINSVIIEPFYGSNESSLRSFLEGNRIDEIYVYKDYQSSIGHTSSFDMTPMAIKMDNVHQVPFSGYQSNVECGESFAEQCLSRVFG